VQHLTPPTGTTQCSIELQRGSTRGVRLKAMVLYGVLSEKSGGPQKECQCAFLQPSDAQATTTSTFTN